MSVNETAVVTHSHSKETDSDRIMLTPPPPDSQAALNKFYIASTGSHDNGSGVPGPVRRKLVQALREGQQVTLSAEVHRSEESSNEEEFEQAVTVASQSERMDQVNQRSGGDWGASATDIIMY